MMFSPFPGSQLSYILGRCIWLQMLHSWNYIMNIWSFILVDRIVSIGFPDIESGWFNVIACHGIKALYSQQNRRPVYPFQGEQGACHIEQWPAASQEASRMQNSGNLLALEAQCHHWTKNFLLNKDWVCLKMSCTPLYPMVLLIIIPIKWLFHWEYTLFSDKPDWFQGLAGV